MFLLRHLFRVVIAIISITSCDDIFARIFPADSQERRDLSLSQLCRRVDRSNMEPWLRFRRLDFVAVFCKNIIFCCLDKRNKTLSLDSWFRLGRAYWPMKSLEFRRKQCDVIKNSVLSKRRRSLRRKKSFIEQEENGEVSQGKKVFWSITILL